MFASVPARFESGVEHLLAQRGGAWTEVRHIIEHVDNQVKSIEVV